MILLSFALNFSQHLTAKLYAKNESCEKKNQYLTREHFGDINKTVEYTIYDNVTRPFVSRPLTRSAMCVDQCMCVWFNMRVWFIRALKITTCPHDGHTWTNQQTLVQIHYENVYFTFLEKILK